MTDIVYYQDETVIDDEGNDRTPGWYFYDETFSYAYGPYSTEQEARSKADEYAKTL